VGIRAALAHRDIEPANGAHSRYIGQMIMVVFDGLSVTPDIQTMIEKYYVGNILLTTRNIRGTFSCTRLPYLLADVVSRRRAGRNPHTGIAEDSPDGGLPLPADDWP
jgi:hypothetical protein